MEQIYWDDFACETRHRQTEMVFEFGNVFLIEIIGFWNSIGLWIR